MTTQPPPSGNLPLHIPAGHPAFAGHFPGRPITPGVVLLDLALSALARLTGQPLAGIKLNQGKFLSPVAPDTTLQLCYELTASQARFTLLDGERKVASGVVEWATPR